MRKTTILSVCLALACTGSVNAQSSEFDALLEDVSFGTAEQMINTQAEEPVAAAAAAATPAPLMQLPPAPVATPAPPEAMPVAPAPVMEQAVPAPVAAPVHAPVAASAPGCSECSSCQSCDSRHGCGLKKRFQEGSCVPYTLPRLPSSTFYQYWRTNACYTNVWDGFRNHCPPNIDLSHHKKHKRTGCASGACQVLPAEWTAAGSSACDNCR